MIANGFPVSLKVLDALVSKKPEDPLILSLGTHKSLCSKVDRGQLGNDGNEEFYFQELTKIQYRNRIEEFERVYLFDFQLC